MCLLLQFAVYSHLIVVLDNLLTVLEWWLLRKCLSVHNILYAK